MASAVFPAPVTSSLNASAITATAANTLYEGRATFDSGVYTITCASGTVANFEFFSNANTAITSGSTTSGTVAINLASTADRVRIWTDTGTSIVVTITKTAAALTNQFSGTLDTVTTVGNSTYTGTSTSGYGYAVLVGGGGSGAGGNVSTGSGGGSGAICSKIVTLTGSMAVTIGAGGTAPATASSNGNAGGASTFDGMSAGGGAGGGASGAAAGGTATGGTYNATGGASSTANTNGAGGAVGSVYKFVVTGTTGGGGSKGGGTGVNGGGSGIGTGGTFVATDTAVTAATGYGSGGAGANGTAVLGGVGRPGVLYVLRF
jgi:hypothetical protein